MGHAADRGNYGDEKWNRIQKGGSTASKNTKVDRGLTEGCIEEVLLVVRDSLFAKFAARKQKAYMRNGSKNPSGVHMKKVPAWLKVLNSYLKRFPKPENTSFSAGEMIGVIIGMIPSAWCKIMAQAGIESREIDVEKLITHPDMLEKVPLEHKDSEGNQNGKRAHSQNNKGRGNKRSKNGLTSNIKVGNNSSHSGKSCDLCKLFKGEDSSAWKTQNTKNRKSKNYFKGKVAGDNKSKPNNYNKDKGNYKKVTP